MLTIEEIVKNIKELNSSAKVELECININGLLNINKNKAFQEANKELLRNEKLIVTGICIEDGFICINGDDYRLLEKELKYFSIKRPAPTFDDLIDAICKAFKNGIQIGNVEFVGCGVSFELFHDDIIYKDNQRAISAAINWINSLYTETFVIESEKDVAKVKIGATVKLVNGNESDVVVLNDPQDSFHVMHAEGALDIFSLYGATVTQKRGDV